MPGGDWIWGFFWGSGRVLFWGYFYQGFFERWGNVLWGMWQRCMKCEYPLEQFSFRYVQYISIG